MLKIPMVHGPAFHYEDYWIVDNEKNRTYQPKLSPKWISEDGTQMVLIWSDAMKNDQGQSHTVHYHLESDGDQNKPSIG